MASVNHSALTGASLHPPFVRSYSGVPTGVATPNFTGELLWDSSNHRLYVAEGATSADWVAAGQAARKLHPLRASPCVAEISNYGDDYTSFGWAGAASPRILHNTAYATLVSGSTIGTSRPNLSRYTNVMTWDCVTSVANADAPGLQLFVRVPPDFTGWDETGIRLLHKVTWQSGDDEPCYVEVEVHDQDVADFGTRIRATRTIAAGTDDTAFSWLQITGADLGANYSAGDYIPIEIKVQKPTVNGGSPNTIRVQFGPLELHWNDL